jgi:transcriptional regulator with XRE-family HTH domain
MSRPRDATFGAALRRALKAAGHNQAWLARQLKCDPGQVSRWVNNKALPHIDTVTEINGLLAVDLSDAYRRPQEASEQSPTDGDSAPADFELFVSAPISGLDDEELEKHRRDVAAVVAAAEKVGPKVYWSGAGVIDQHHRPAADLATEVSLRALERCSAYLYLQFAEMRNPSGALVELGIALGRKLKTTMILKKAMNTPYMFEGLGGVAAKLQWLPEVHIYLKDPNEAVQLIEASGRDLLL